MIHFHRRTREQAAKHMVAQALPAGWSIDAEPYHDKVSRLWIVTASGPVFWVLGEPRFRLRGGSGRTRVSAWEDLYIRLRERHVKVVLPTRLAALVLLLAGPMLALSIAWPAFTVAANPTPSSSSPAPSASPTPMPLVLAVPTVYPSLEPLPTPRPTIALPDRRYYFRETCAGYGMPPTAAQQAAYRELRSRFGAYGVRTGEWACAASIMGHESRFRAWVHNGYDACGLPQAWPCSKLARACPGWNVGPGYAIGCQVSWFMAYVRQKYGTFYAAAAYKFGYRTAAGVWVRGQGIY